MTRAGTAALVLGIAGRAAAEQLTALFVVGTPPDQPLYADRIYKERLERQAYTVKLIQDKAEGLADWCEKSDVMFVSASISGGAVGKQLNNCTTPQMIWESRTFGLNGMTANVDEALRVTSQFFHENQEVAFDNDPEKIPPLPTGPWVDITAEGAASALSGPSAEGNLAYWTVSDYGMNYMDESQLGEGAKVVAILPPSKTGDFPVNPEGKKATFFYYEKGGKLVAPYGTSPAFRIAWPVFGFVYGPSPSCEEVGDLPCVDDSCQKNCQTAEQIVSSGKDPMPLSCQGVQMLDKAISMLTKQARLRRRTPQVQEQALASIDG